MNLPSAAEIRSFSTAIPTDEPYVQAIRAGVGVMMTTVADFGLAIPDALDMLADGRPNDPGARLLAGYAAVVSTPFALLDSMGRAVIPNYAGDYTEIGDAVGVMVTSALLTKWMPGLTAALGAVHEAVYSVHEGLADGELTEEEAATALTVDLWGIGIAAAIGRYMPGFGRNTNPRTTVDELMGLGRNAAGAVVDEVVGATGQTIAALMFDPDSLDFSAGAVELFSDGFDAVLAETLSAVIELDEVLAFTVYVYADYMAARGEDEAEVTNLLTQVAHAAFSVDISAPDRQAQAASRVSLALQQYPDIAADINRLEETISRMHAEAIARDLTASLATAP